MKEAFGGIFSIQWIIIFLVVVNCFLAFGVNYTKAFRVKNEIRSIIERQEGLTCSAKRQIKELLLANHYHQNSNFTTWCSNHGYTPANVDGMYFCYKYNPVSTTGDGAIDPSQIKGAYYTIATFVDINIPIFDRIFAEIAGGLFLVKGETAMIYSANATEGFTACTSD